MNFEGGEIGDVVFCFSVWIVCTSDTGSSCDSGKEIN